jgi:hypothetical protein
MEWCVNGAMQYCLGNDKNSLYLFSTDAISCKYFHSWLVESADIEPTDKEG